MAKPHTSPQRKLRWMRLDNAAKIYPAACRSNWSNVFRVSVTLKENVDEKILRAALDVTVRRFPSIATRLRRGLFWYYLEELKYPLQIQEENSYPVSWMSAGEVRQCALRVLVYKGRIAVEIFHSLTDGNGAMVFLKSLTAEYLQQRYKIHIPAEHGVLGRLEEPSAQELEDSFQRYAGPVGISRKGNEAWRMSGSPEPKGFLHVTCFQIPVEAVLEKAHSYGVTLTTFLCAVVMDALQTLQKQKVPDIRYRRPIKLQVPVNLRRIFPSRSLRNFAMYVTPEIMPRLGSYTLEEICQEVHHTMGRELTTKHMSRMIATNVSVEKLMAVKLMPLFVKNLVMKMVFNSVGERMSCLSVSNLGKVELPEQMKPYVKRMDFILGVQATKPYNCGVLSYDKTLYVNFIRNTREPELEVQVHRILRDMGIPVLVESNRPD